jgi:hypothetical protein
MASLGPNPPLAGKARVLGVGTGVVGTTHLPYDLGPSTVSGHLALSREYHHHQRSDELPDIEVDSRSSWWIGSALRADRAPERIVLCSV